MVGTRSFMHKVGLRTWGLLMLAALAGGCGFKVTGAVDTCGPRNSPNWIGCMLDMAPYRAADSNVRKTIYEANGLIRTLHGESCVKAPRANGGSTVGFRVKDSASVPMTLGDSGIVFMNGWKLRYTSGDHHVQGLGSAIVNVTHARRGDQFVLDWEAGGVLTDQNGDDPYQWCYDYTVVFWSRSSAAFDAVVASSGLPSVQNTDSDPGNTTALRALNGLATNVYGPGVLLPQGFAMIFGDDDHHLLQLGFDFGQHYDAGSGATGWTSRTLLKDNDTRRNYFAAELVATLSYSSPRSYHPDMVQLKNSNNTWKSVSNRVALQPYGSESFCSGVGGNQATEQYKVEGVPFEYAVPVLKGWELGYVCTDHHVREIGAQIVDWRYERAPNATTGTLYYTLKTSLTDDSDNVSYAKASVDIFGMNARGISTHPIVNVGAIKNMTTLAN